MRSSVKERAASLSATGELGSSAYNLTRGLRAVYCGSAFLPAFVLEECHAALDDIGFDFVRKCIEAIEDKGIREQGLYRNCGVTSKVQKLMQIGLDKRRSVNEKFSFTDDEWEIKTLSSALKTFLRNLPEPLMTFELHPHFINAAKMDSKTRVACIHFFVHKLPQIHFEMLQIIIEHLRKVADRSAENLMTVGNLGVCFGPTLLRPKEETMAAIMDIKFCNVIVEVLIANYDLIFKKKPMNIDSIPCPPKPNHQEEIVSESSSSCVEAASFSSQETLPNYREEKRLEEEELSSVSNRPQTIPSSTVRQRPPPIYDRVACSYMDSSNDVSVKTSNRLVLAYGKPSTSAGTSPVTPTGSNSLTCSSSGFTQTVAKSQVGRPLQAFPVEHARTINRERRGHERKICAESSESLSSVASGSDPSPSPNERLRYQTNPVQENISASRAKVSTSYAPTYNPFLSDSSIIASMSSIGVSDCRSGRHKMSSPLPISQYQQYRGPSIPRPSKSINSVGGGALAAIGTEAVLSDLRVSPLFTHIHPLGTLQPSRRVKTLYACTAGHDTELSFQPGQIITNVYESKEEGWLVGTLNGKTGLIPANYVEPLP